MAVMTTTSTGITPTQQTYFDKQLLDYAKPLIVTAQFAQKKPFPKNKGTDTIKYFRPNVPDRNRVVNLVEGVPIAQFAELTYTPISVTLAQFGEAIKISDILSMTDLFSTLDNGVRMMGEDAGVQADFKCVQQVVTGVNAANKRYAGGATSFAALQALTAAGGKLQIADMLGSFTQLTNTKAKKPEGGAYAFIVSPQQAYDIMLDTKFVDAGVRGNNKGLFNGEIGNWYGNRILVTTEGWIELATEGTYDSTGGIYAAMALGRDCLGAPIMAGNSPFSPSIITNNSADSGNPLKQFMTAGWKAYWNTVTLNDTWEVVVRSKSTFA